jgi:hypothetical protein
LSIRQGRGAFGHDGFAGIQAGNQFNFVTDAASSFDEAQLRVSR